MSINFKDMAKSIVDNYADLMLPSTDRLDELEFMILQGFLAIKDELIRVMPEEDLRGKNIDNIPDYQLGKLSGWNYYRSQMISAITKICEEGKCTN